MNTCKKSQIIYSHKRSKVILDFWSGDLFKIISVREILKININYERFPDFELQNPHVIFTHILTNLSLTLMYVELSAITLKILEAIILSPEITRLTSKLPPSKYVRLVLKTNDKDVAKVLFMLHKNKAYKNIR